MYFPKISIIIPAYNASNYLSEAIDSALAQTYTNYEIIIVNDGSRDDGATEKVALSYGDKIRYFNKKNGGSSSALNYGIANMTGDWFSWLSHDDLYTPEKLERQIEYINSLNVDENDLQRHIFFSASVLIDGKGKIIRGFDKSKANIISEKLNSFPHNGYLISEPTEYNFHGCSCLIHRKAFEDIGVFNENLRLLNDVDLWFRVYSAGYKIHYIPEPLVKGRVHGAQVSKTIGYSYHNAEQDMFWNRSLDWLITNHPNDQKLYYSFTRNAYLKTRTEEADRAVRHLYTLGKKYGDKMAVLKHTYKLRASLRNLAKQVYLKIKT